MLKGFQVVGQAPKGEPDERSQIRGTPSPKFDAFIGRKQIGIEKTPANAGAFLRILFLVSLD